MLTFKDYFSRSFQISLPPTPPSPIHQAAAISLVLSHQTNCSSTPLGRRWGPSVPSPLLRLHPPIVLRCSTGLIRRQSGGGEGGVEPCLGRKNIHFYKSLNLASQILNVTPIYCAVMRDWSVFILKKNPDLPLKACFRSFYPKLRDNITLKKKKRLKNKFRLCQHNLETLVWRWRTNYSSNQRIRCLKYFAGLENRCGMIVWAIIG